MVQPLQFPFNDEGGDTASARAQQEGFWTMDRLSNSEADRDLERRVMSFLAGRHVPALRNLAVQASGGVVTVSGRVLTFYEKQLCNQCCRRVAGVLELINAVDVMHAQSAIVA